MVDKKSKKGISKRKMLFKMVFSSLVRRKSRMVVALLAVTIGAVILSGLMTIYYDIPRQMGKEFRSYGANLVILPANKEKLITKADIDSVKEKMSSFEVEGITPLSYENIRVNGQTVILAGTDFQQLLKTRPFLRVSGSLPQNENQVVIGSEIASKFRLKIDSVVNLEYKESTGQYSSNKFKVCGIAETGKSEDSMIFVSFSSFAEVVKKPESFDVIELSVIAKKDKLEMLAQSCSQSESMRAKLVKRVASSEDTVLSKLQALVWLVSIIVLILTMISVGTTMMAAVMERRQEIGLKKALGASDKSIKKEFLYEGLFLGGVGGAIGMLLGFWFAQTVSMTVFGRSIVLESVVALLTIVVSVIITGIAMFVPVKRATEIDPALVLKGE